MSEPYSIGKVLAHSDNHVFEIGSIGFRTCTYSYKRRCDLPGFLPIFSLLTTAYHNIFSLTRYLLTSTGISSSASSGSSASSALSALSASSASSASSTSSASSASSSLSSLRRPYQAEIPFVFKMSNYLQQLQAQEQGAIQKSIIISEYPFVITYFSMSSRISELCPAEFIKSYTTRFC